MGKAYFPMYNSYLKRTENLTDSELGRLVRALMTYSTYGTKPDLNGRERIVFDFIAYDIDEAANNYAEMCEKKRENINKRWEKEDTGEYNRIQPNTAEYNRIQDDTKDTKEKQKQKQKLKQKESTIPPVSPLPGEPADLSAFDGDLKQAVEEWLRYKSERHESYKPTGHKLLLSQIANKAKEYGDAAVAEVIRTSISSGYKGIVFDRLERGKKREEPRTDSRAAAMDAMVAEFMREDDG